MTAPVMEDKGPPLGRKIASLRALHGWSQRQLAGELNMAPETLSRIETGRIRPSVELLAKLARMFGTTMDYIVNHEPPNQSAA
jgi:Predicted transcriptional regulators